VELKKRRLLEMELASEKTKFAEFDQILKFEQKKSAVLSQQSRIISFLAPNPYVNNYYDIAADATPRPGLRYLHCVLFLLTFAKNITNPAVPCGSALVI
jgi:hypothetical protein